MFAKAAPPVVLSMLALGCLPLAACGGSTTPANGGQPAVASSRAPAAGAKPSPDPIAAIAEAMGDAATPREAPPSVSPPSLSSTAAPLAYDVPAGFEAEPPSSNMRLAQFRLPGAGQTPDASLVLYYFGPGSAGTTQANLQRWIGQMQPPAGRAPGANAHTKAWTNGVGLAVTQVDVAGRYVAQSMPGGGERHDDPDSRMIAAVVETPRGAVYFKAVGPAATIARWEKDLTAMLQGARVP